MAEENIEPESPAPPAAAEPAPGGTATPSASPKGKSFPARHSAAFKTELLRRLIELPEPKWDSTTALNIFQDMKEISALDAEAFLQPLEALTERQHGR